jgi:hypothetical protein
MQDDLLSGEAELRLETNIDAPHRLTIYTASAEPQEVAALLNKRRLGLVDGPARLS